MKVSNKLFIGAGVLGLAIAATVGSTYAWFSMNTSVTVTGMTITAKTDDNIMVSTSNTSDSNYVTGLNKTVSAILEPVSSIDGINFYYHSTANKVDGNGKGTGGYIAYNEATSLANAGAGKNAYDAAFQTNYKITGEISAENVVYGYADYFIYVKATNAQENAQNLSLTTCNLTYQGNVVTDKSWRVAMFTYKIEAGVGSDVEKATVLGTAADTILKSSDAVYYTANSAANSTSTTLALVNNLASPAIVGSVVARSTSYYAIVIRLWLEGEDTDCKTDTYAQLTKEYNLDLIFKFQASGVSALSSNVTAIATVDGANTLKASAALSVPEELTESYQWYDASDNSAVVGATEAEYTATADGRFYCVITTTKGSQYRTNTVSLASGS